MSSITQRTYTDIESLFQIQLPEDWLLDTSGTGAIASLAWQCISTGGTGYLPVRILYRLVLSIP